MAFPLVAPPNQIWAGLNPAVPYSGTFIPEIWSGKLLEKFYAATVMAAISNTDYEGEIKGKGDKVKIRQRPTISILDYQANMDLAVQRPSADILELLIDRGKYFNVALDDVMDVQSDIDMMSIWSEDASEQFKIAVDLEVLTSLSTSTAIDPNNWGDTAGKISNNIDLGLTGAGVTLTKDNVLDFIVDAGTVLDEQNVPETGRWMVIPAAMAGLIKKSDLKDASLAGDGTSIMRNGRLGMIDRFTLYLSNQLPGTGSEKFVFFGTNAALSFASQFTKVETIRSERSFSTLLRGLQVYGYGVLNGVAMGRGVVEVTNSTTLMNVDGSKNRNRDGQPDPRTTKKQRSGELGQLAAEPVVVPAFPTYAPDVVQRGVDTEEDAEARERVAEDRERVDYDRDHRPGRVSPRSLPGPGDGTSQQIEDHPEWDKIRKDEEASIEADRKKAQQEAERDAKRAQERSDKSQEAKDTGTKTKPKT